MDGWTKTGDVTGVIVGRILETKYRIVEDAIHPRCIGFAPVFASADDANEFVATLDGPAPVLFGGRGETFERDED